MQQSLQAAELESARLRTALAGAKAQLAAQAERNQRELELLRDRLWEKTFHGGLGLQATIKPARDVAAAEEPVISAADFELQKQPQDGDLTALRTGIAEIQRLVSLTEGRQSASPAPGEGSLGSYPISDVTGSSEGADNFLSQVVSWDDLPKTNKTPAELLARPPPKFIYDVCLLVY